MQEVCGLCPGLARVDSEDPLCTSDGASTLALKPMGGVPKVRNRVPVAPQNDDFITAKFKKKSFTSCSSLGRAARLFGRSTNNPPALCDTISRYFSMVSSLIFARTHLRVTTFASNERASTFTKAFLLPESVNRIDYFSYLCLVITHDELVKS